MIDPKEISQGKTRELGIEGGVIPRLRKDNVIIPACTLRGWKDISKTGSVG